MRGRPGGCPEDERTSRRTIGCPEDILRTLRGHFCGHMKNRGQTKQGMLHTLHGSVAHDGEIVKVYYDLGGQLSLDSTPDDVT